MQPPQPTPPPPPPQVAVTRGEEETVSQPVPVASPSSTDAPADVGNASNSTATAPVAPPPTIPRRRQRRRRQLAHPYLNSRSSQCRRVMQWCCFPCVVLTTTIGVVIFLVFCAFPLFLFVVALLSVYYCCSPDPIPPRILFQALWDDTDDWAGVERRTTPAYTVDQIQAALIRRVCLGLWSEDNPDGPPLSWAERVQPGPLTVRTERRALVFSTPLKRRPQQSGTASTAGTASALSTSSSAPSSHPNEASEVASVAGSEDSGIHDEAVEAGNVPVAMSLSEPPLQQGNGPSVRIQLDVTVTEMAVEAHGLEGISLSPIPLEDCKMPDVQQPAANEAEADLEQGGLSPAVEHPVDPPCPGIPDETKASTLVCHEEHDYDDDDDESVRERGAFCDICLVEYAAGDVVVWSRNRSCDHAYHESCITSWLLRNSTCPSCRQPYVIVGNKTEETA